MVVGSSRSSGLGGKGKRRAPPPPVPAKPASLKGGKMSQPPSSVASRVAIFERGGAIPPSSNLVKQASDSESVTAGVTSEGQQQQRMTFHLYDQSESIEVSEIIEIGEEDSEMTMNIDVDSERTK